MTDFKAKLEAVLKHNAEWASKATAEKASFEKEKVEVDAQWQAAQAARLQLAERQKKVECYEKRLEKLAELERLGTHLSLLEQSSQIEQREVMLNNQVRQVNERMKYLRQALDATSASYQSCVAQLASMRDKVGTGHGQLSLKEEYGQVRSIAEKRLNAFSESACRQNGKPQELAGEAASGLRLTGGVEGGQRMAGSREGGQDELPGGLDEVRRDRRPGGGRGSKEEGELRRKRKCGEESHHGYNFQIGISTEAADSRNLGKVGKLGVSPDGGVAIFCSCGPCIKKASECECDCATCVSGLIFGEKGKCSRYTGFGLQTLNV